ncbi:hypothetical protein [Candidatus Methylomicrobium oryzae]|uniref:hypothetical protein n=1 Tax=Candidatus Methylomicrobium oryzae TaxID=2802053 RepID=UPI0019209527|nr:hypothetical protein [Methylomicrobium sp. RS1]MBL1262497.1 hypothetical protein [Methylomicrobium sp. RS1]
MLSRLRFPKNRACLRFIICILMVSWLSMLISNTCTMPASTFAAPADSMPAGCAEMAPSALQAGKHAAMPDQDCSFKPCLDSHPNPAFEAKIDKPPMPIFALCLIGLLGWLSHCLISVPRIPRTTSPPIGRRVLLIYRFCTLLN